MHLLHSVLTPVITSVNIFFFILNLQKKKQTNNLKAISIALDQDTCSMMAEYITKSFFLASLLTAFMHASKGILNLPTSSLHLCSPLQQNR